MILFILASVGATIIVTNSFLFKPIRQYAEMKANQQALWHHPLIDMWRYINKFVSCAQCIGFWMGVLIGIVLNPVYPELYSIFDNWLLMTISLFLCGCISSIISFVTALIIDYLCKLT